MIDIIIISLIITVNFVVGFMLGRAARNPQLVEDIKKEIKRKMNTGKVGAVTRPSAQQLANWKNPKKYQEEEAMAETLAQFPELQPKK